MNSTKKKELKSYLKLKMFRTSRNVNERNRFVLLFYNKNKTDC